MFPCVFVIRPWRLLDVEYVPLSDSRKTMQFFGESNTRRKLRRKNKLCYNRK